MLQTPKFEIPLKTRLEKCNTMGDVFKMITDQYDLFSKPIPLVYKAIIINGIVMAIDWIKPNRK
jgi:hypothetical protein